MPVMPDQKPTLEYGRQTRRRFPERIGKLITGILMVSGVITAAIGSNAGAGIGRLFIVGLTLWLFGLVTMVITLAMR